MMNDLQCKKGCIKVAEEEKVAKEKVVEEKIELEAVKVENKNEDTKSDSDQKVKEKPKEKSLEDQLKEKKAESKDSLDRLQRTMAEFDNFRKRTIKEKSQMYERGAKEILESLLPVVDNFERAFGTAENIDQNDPFIKGIDMIYKQLVSALHELGVEEIKALDQPFDQNLHHAVHHEESEEHDKNMVVEVFQKGYMYKDSVLRYSMVKVVN